MKQARPRRDSASGWWVLLLVLGLGCSCAKQSPLDRLLAEAKRGNAEAQYQLGEYYHDPPGLSPDYASAASWFRQAAERGHAAAQWALGEMCLQGQEGMLPDELEGFRWMQKAAEQGFAPAQDELSLLYWQGTGVAPDPGAAFTWASRAAEQGYVEAQCRLGCMLSTNVPERGPAEPIKAGMWLILAAGEGFAEAEDALNALKPKLSPTELEEATRRAENWKRKHEEAGKASRP